MFLQVFTAEEVYGVADDVSGDNVRLLYTFLEDFLNMSIKSAPFSDETFLW